MDHAQGRAFHHHLARAIMHLNHLAGLLPFFEPSIEWDDSMPSSHFRLERPTFRGLHTFVPLPPSSLPPTMVSHGGIPSQMILNPEPNLRPTTPHQSLHRDTNHTSSSHNEPCNPVLTMEHSVDPTPGTSIVAELLESQPGPQSLSLFGPNNGPHQLRTHGQRKNKNRHQCIPTTERCGRPGPLPIISEVPPGGFNSDDSDNDVVSGAASAHDHPELSPPRNIHYHFHHTTWHFHSHLDTESKCTTTTTNHPYLPG